MLKIYGIICVITSATFALYRMMQQEPFHFDVMILCCVGLIAQEIAEMRSKS